MPAVILDACGTVNLCASGHFVEILKALKNDWYLPAAVAREAQYYRQPDPQDGEKLIVTPIDLLTVISSGLITLCDCESDEETELFVELAAKIGDDGESMGLAIAKCRGWSVFTDDKKARKIATELGVPVMSTLEIIKRWSEVINPSAVTLATALLAIERFANYKPSRGMADLDWWQNAIKALGC